MNERTSGVRRSITVALRTAVILMFVAGITTAAVIYSGERELALSTAALNEGRGQDAVASAKRAALWYAPFAPHVDVAYRRLIAIAEAAQAHGDVALAQSAWSAVREAALETRSILSPHEADKTRATEALAKLYASVPESAGQKALSPEELERRYLRALLRAPGTTPFWSAIMVLALGLVLSAFGGIAFWAVDHAGHFSKNRLTIGLGALGLGAALWALALYSA